MEAGFIASALFLNIVTLWVVAIYVYHLFIRYFIHFIHQITIDYTLDDKHWCIDNERTYVVYCPHEMQSIVKNIRVKKAHI